MDEEKQKQIENINAELRCLHSDLVFSNEYGDWKIIKCQEYILAGKELPYDIDELSKKRQQIRNKINELESELNRLNNI